MYWRPGSKVHRTLYRGDELVGLVDTPALAMEIVTAVNARGRSLVEVAADSIEAFAAKYDDPTATNDERNVAYGMRQALSILRRIAEREQGRERSQPFPRVVATAVCGACYREVGVTDDRRLIHHDGEQNRYCRGSREIATSPQPRDAQRRSEATPQKDLLDPSRVDPYDTQKGGITEP